MESARHGGGGLVDFLRIPLPPFLWLKCYTVLFLAPPPVLTLFPHPPRYKNVPQALWKKHILFSPPEPLSCTFPTVIPFHVSVL